MGPLLLLYLLLPVGLTASKMGLHAASLNSILCGGLTHQKAASENGLAVDNIFDTLLPSSSKYPCGVEANGQGAVVRGISRALRIFSLRILGILGTNFLGYPGPEKVISGQ